MIWTPEQQAAAKALIKRHEGLALKPYTDTRGFLTIGRGRSLTTRGISVAEADFLFDNDFSAAIGDLMRQDWWDKLDAPRQIAILDMAFEVGAHGILAFKEMIAALLAQKWGSAADAMMQSRWAQEVPHRANDDSMIILTGRLPGEL